MTKELEQLLEKARGLKMTPTQLREQRQSFAYGNTHIENERITREMVAEADSKIEDTEFVEEKTSDYRKIRVEE
jgi:hypothetical protein